jgi:chromosome segregation ATPase
VNSAADSQKQLSKQIKIYENRLDKAIQKYNQTVAQNKKLRSDIDTLRKDRNMYEANFRRLQEDLNKKRNAMSDAITSAENAYKNRERALEELEELKQRNEEEQKKFETEWNELVQQIDQDKKKREFIQLKEREKRVESVLDINPEDEDKIKNLTVLSEAEKQKTQESLELVQSYEDAIQKIKEATGLQSFQELIDAFMRYEEKNSTLVRFVSEMTAELESLEKQISEMNVEISRFKSQDAYMDHSKKKELQIMEEKLSQLEFKNQINGQRYKESIKTLTAVKDQLKGILEALDPNEPLIQDMDEEGITEDNMMKYLSEIEKKANKIIQSYALIQAQKLQVDAIMKDDPSLHRSNISTLNNIMTIGSQVPSNTNPIRIELPGLRNVYTEDDEDDGFDIEDEEFPLTIDEIRQRVERNLQSMKLSKNGSKNRSLNNKRVLKK